MTVKLKKVDESQWQCIQDIGKKQYGNIHNWLKYNFQKPDYCENENCDHSSKKLQWALIHGRKYERNRDNFICLCSKCHINYDMNEKRREIYSLAQTGKIRAKSAVEKQNAKKMKPVYKLDDSGTILDTYRSINDAAKQCGIGANDISSVLSGRNSKSGGFGWRYVNSRDLLRGRWRRRASLQKLEEIK